MCETNATGEPSKNETAIPNPQFSPLQGRAPMNQSAPPRPIRQSLPKQILILGGGFGGLYAALQLEKTVARDPRVKVTLVNRENFFLFTPMLHEVRAPGRIVRIARSDKPGEALHEARKGRGGPQRAQ
jgi:hypothetical protein